MKDWRQILSWQVEEESNPVRLCRPVSDMSHYWNILTGGYCKGQVYPATYNPEQLCPEHGGERIVVE